MYLSEWIIIASLLCHSFFSQIPFQKRLVFEVIVWFVPMIEWRLKINYIIMNHQNLIAIYSKVKLCTHIIFSVVSVINIKLPLI